MAAGSEAHLAVLMEPEAGEVAVELLSAEQDG